MCTKALSEVLEDIFHSRPFWIREIRVAAVGFCNLIPEPTKVSIIASLLKPPS